MWDLSCIRIAFSTTLVNIDKFDIGLKCAGTVGSRLGFLRSGVIWAVL